VTAAAVETATAPPRRDPWTPAARRWRLVLVLGWLFLVGAALVGGARQSTFADLQRAVASGDVTEVQVGGGMEDGARGFATVELSWRDDLIRYQTSVIEARPFKRAPGPGERSDDVTAVLGQDVETKLLALQPGLDIGHTQPYRLSGSAAGWHLSGWTMLLLAGLWFGTILTIIGGPEPWRATRWAWFWLVAIVGPAGIAAYLLLSGPAPLLRAPLNLRARLTGGWAFILAIVVDNLLRAVS
jgi:hypothetical protein